jgi:hypothetical protein
MKNLVFILVFLIVNAHGVCAQENPELKKIKCLENMPDTYEKIKELATYESILTPTNQ